jgi:two-component system, chemotaxis family, sensor kinase CheA
MSILDPGANKQFFAQFLDDYFQECEEHFTIVRRGLLALERFVGSSEIDRPILDDLFRAFHSLKGLSGMVGVRPAEELSHEMEAYLRAVRDNASLLNKEGVDALIVSASTLESVVEQRRAGSVIGDVGPVLARLAAILPDIAAGNGASETADSAVAAPADSLNASERSKLEGAIKEGARALRFEFVPSAALAQQGINVNAIRTKLSSIGELIQAAPRVLSGGALAFHFLVASHADDKELEALQADGLTFRADEPLAKASISTNGRGNIAALPPVSDAHISGAPARSTVVRVELNRLDDLMRMVGDLVISRSHLDERLRTVEASMPQQGWRGLQETNVTMGRQLRDLREAVMRARMVPIGEIFERMRFVVRDLAREYNKDVRIELSGEHIEIDKVLVERMMDPILHLVRNAVSHGIESSAKRAELGKAQEARISLRASTFADMAVIQVEDDGAGIDREAVIKRGQALGLLDPASDPDNAAILDLICAPGFSTREAADRAAGRGVGMSVVKRTVEAIGGSLSLDTEPGRGTLFSIQLPLTLAIADALIVSVGQQRFVIPQLAVREVLKIDSGTIKALENNEIIPYRGATLPLLRLARLFGLSQQETTSFHALVVEGSPAVGIVVDRILGQREIVVRSISDPLLQVQGIAGATELGDGRIVLILDPAALVSTDKGGPGGGRGKVRRVNKLNTSENGVRNAG